MVKSIKYVFLAAFCFSISSFSFAMQNPQEELDKITSRPGEVKGIVIKKTPTSVTVVEQPYKKPPETKTYKKDK